MKLMAILLLAFNLQVSATAVAQRITLRVHEQSLERVLQQLRAQSGYAFIYNTDYLRQARPVSVQIENQDILEALPLIFQDQPFTYTVENRMITLKPKSAEYRTNTVRVAAIPRVRGRVTDSLGQPLQGASVRVINAAGQRTTLQTLTDSDGYFVLDDVPEDAVLEITYIGYQKRIVEVAEELGTITLRLQPSTLGVVEVVSTGYETLSRERAAGSFGVVNEATLQQRSNANILSYLEGQVAGLLMAPNGDITIRGRSTISADRDPLIVVDGFPIERSIEAINPNDIESITVLKDASAASIWGVRAANGVVVIQTKRGRSSRNALDIDFSSTFSVTPAADLSELPFASAASFIELEKYKVDQGLTYFTGTPRPAISPIVDAYLHRPAEADALAAQIQQYKAYAEFQDLFLRPATRQQYALGIAGTGERSSFRGSFSYDNIKSEFKADDSERFVADLFNSFELHPRLRLDLGLNAVYRVNNNNGMDYSAIRQLLPYQRILDDQGQYVVQPQTFYQADKDAFVQAGYPYAWDYNLMQEFRNKSNQGKATTLNATASAHYQLLDGLNAHVGYQYELGNNVGTSLLNEETYYVRNLVNYATSRVNGALVSGVPKGSIYRESYDRMYSHTLRGQLGFDRSLSSDDHYLTAIAGMEIREVGNKASNQTKYGYDPQSLQFTRVDYTHRYTDVRGGQSLIPDETLFQNNRDRFVSIYTNAGYTLREKYTVNASARLDKTNLFGSSDQYRNVWLWSSGFSWQVHKEDFLQAPFINSLIVRATYGINGNVDRSTSPFLIANVATDFQTNRPYAYVANPQNPLLRWERTAVTNIGIDFALFNRRLSGSLEYYKKVSDDLLGNATVNGTYGFENAFINYAGLNNRGFDVRLSGLLIDRAFKWNARLIYSYNKNRVTEVDFPQQTVGAYLAGTPQEGKPLDYLYSYAWAGLSPTGAPQVYNQNQEITPYTAEMANVQALLYEGTGVAPHYGSLIQEFSYKRFSLLANFTYKMGHKFRVPVIQYEPLLSGAMQAPADWDQRWQQPGDEAFINVQTASYIRFRELLIHYDLPDNLLKTNRAAQFSVGLQIRNLALYTFNSADLDPEYLIRENIEQRNQLMLSPQPEYSLILRANF